MISFDLTMIMPYVWLAAPFAVGFVVLLIAVRILRKVLTARAQVARSFDNVVLMVTVPKEAGEKDQGQREKSLQEIQAGIALAEGVFKSIGGLKAERGFKAWMVGRSDAVSFEIVAKEGLVSFYVVHRTAGPRPVSAGADRGDARLQPLPAESRGRQRAPGLRPRELLPAAYV
jgi:hypothetical protein